jgi:hypothetical protein
LVKKYKNYRLLKKQTSLYILKIYFRILTLAINKNTIHMKKLLFIYGLSMILSSTISAQSMCPHVVDNDFFSTPSDWTATGAGLVTVSNGTCRFQAANCGVYDRIYRPLDYALSDTYFKAEMEFTITANPITKGAGANLLAFAGGVLDPLSYDASQSYALTNQDAIVLELVSASPTNNNINNWSLSLDSKDGLARTIGTNAIQLSAQYLTYYVVMTRTSSTSVTVEAYLDAAHTQLHGQATNTISAGITGLNYMHIGVTTFGATTRQNSLTVDNIEICDNDLSGIYSTEAENPFTIFPNPSSDGQIAIQLNGHHPEKITIYDANGRMVLEESITNLATVFNLNLNSGLYAIVITEDQKQFVFREIVE